MTVIAAHANVTNIRNLKRKMRPYMREKNILETLKYTIINYLFRKSLNLFVQTFWGFPKAH